MRLMIAIPCMDTVYTQFMDSLLKLTDRLHRVGIEHEVAIKSGTLVYLARDALTARAIQSTYTHVLWLDSDMVFDPMLAERLLDADKDLVTAVYHQRRPPFRPAVFTRLVPRVEPLDIGDRVPGSDGWDSEQPERLVRIAACGFGCVLTKREMLEDIYLHYKKAFTPSEAFGEDMMFCIRAHDLGYEMYCDTSIRCGHIGRITINPDDVPALEKIWR